MRSERAARLFLSAFGLALAAYVMLYLVIEKGRGNKGPWQAEFTASESSAPVLRVDQPALGITNVQFVFPGRFFPATNRATIVFADPKAVPFDLPFGKCVFLDTTFLPGTVTIQAFGHEIEFLPRVLVVDHTRRNWRSGECIVLEPPRSGELASH